RCEIKAGKAGKIAVCNGITVARSCHDNEHDRGVLNLASKSKEIIRQPGAWLGLLLCFLAVMAPLALAAREASQRRSMKAPAPDSLGTMVAAANQEGKIVVFGPAGELIRSALIEAFRKSFPRIIFEYVGGRAA